MHILGKLAGASALCALAAPAAGSPVRRGKPQYTVHPDRMAAVQQAFQTSWDGYYTYAFPHDSLKPVSRSYMDDRNGWGASAVDALSTAVIMGHAEAVQQILAHIADIDFDTATGDVSLFETTIRYLGGILSGYDLLADGVGGLDVDPALLQAALAQATKLADNLKVAFDTPSGVPDNNVRFAPPRRGGSVTNGLATVGTLVMEWTRLSDLTGDAQYAALAQKAESYLLDPQPRALAEPFPGLVGTNINITDGTFLDGDGGWIGGDDSFYEYLIKMYAYDPARFAAYKDRWTLAVDSSKTYLASHPSTRPDLTFLAQYAGTTRVLRSEHLACFDGGNIILGGLYLDRPDYVQFGLDLTASCHATYAATATGIGPEVFRWHDASSATSDASASAAAAAPVPVDQADFYAENGFWIDTAQYVLRPEVVESYYYAYRATGDPQYQEWAWDAFLAVNATCAAGVGYSAINDVREAGGGGFTDAQESFWFAEVLKYFYLIQADDAAYQIQADASEGYVFNTECHPIKKA